MELCHEVSASNDRHAHGIQRRLAHVSPPQAKRRCNAVIASIFVNPTQFSATEDLDAYPAFQPEVRRRDLAMLEQAGVAAVYAPENPWEMYPQWPPFRSFVHPEGSAAANEGAARPHFFRGVATVVTKLFNTLPCQTAFFGAKDAYQCIVVKNLLRDLHLPHPQRIHIVPTQRYVSGLAASSRNAYLSEQQRDMAPALLGVMQQAAEWVETTVRHRGGALQAQEYPTIVEACRSALGGVAAQLGGGGIPPFTVEYISLMDAVSGEDVSDGNQAAVEASAAYLRQHGTAVKQHYTREQTATPEQGATHPPTAVQDGIKWAPGDAIPHVVPCSYDATYAERFVYAPPSIPDAGGGGIQPPLVLSGAIRLLPAAGSGHSMVRLLDNIVVCGSEQLMGGLLPEHERM